MINRGVTFYILGIEEVLDFMAKLADKLYLSQERALFFLSETEEIHFLDSKIWTSGRLSFVPHGSCFSVTDEFIVDCPIWISDKIETYNSPTCLVHKQDSVIQNIDLSFCKVIDISKAEAINSKIISYKNLGFNEFKAWKQENSKWRSINLEST